MGPVGSAPRSAANGVAGASSRLPPHDKPQAPLPRRFGLPAAVTVIIALLGLLGWITGPLWLTSWGSSFATMKPVTGVVLVVLGAALWLGPDHRRGRQLAWAAVALAALSLAQDVLGRELGWEAVLASRFQSPGPGTLGWRMSPATAVGVLAGAAGILLAGRAAAACAVLALVAAGIAVFALLGYASGADALYRLTPFGSLSLPTAAALLSVGAGLLARSGLRLEPTRPRPLRQLLLLLAAAIVGPLLLFGITTGGRIAQAQLEQSQAELAAAARTLSAAVDREITGEIETLLALAASPSLRQGDIAAFYSQAQATLDVRRRGAILLVAPDGQMLMTTRLPFGSALPMAARADLAREVAATGQPRVSGVFTGRIAQTLVFNILVPVRIDGEVRYVIVRSPGVGGLVRLLAETELHPGWLAGVSDGANRIIARSKDQETFVGHQLSQAARWPGGRSGLIAIVDLENRLSLQAYVRSEVTGWRTAVWAPRALLEAPVRALWRTTAIMGLMALALVLGLGLWLSRLIEQSMAMTVKAAKALGEGRPVDVPVTAVAEANTLGLAMRQASDARAGAEADLRESEARLTSALRSGELGVHDYDIRSGRIGWDAAVYRLWGIPQGEPVTIATFEAGIHPEDRAAVKAAVEAACRPEGPRRFVSEYRVIARDDDTERWVHADGDVSFEGDIAVRLVGTVRDITVRKQAQADTARLAAIVTSSADAILSKTLDGTITSWNAAAERLFGYTEAEMTGQSIRRMIPPERQSEEEMIVAAVESGSGIDRFETVRVSKSGREIVVAITVSPIRDAQGRIVGASKIVRDITEQKRAEHALIIAAQRAEIAQKAAKAMNYELVPSTGEVVREAAAFESLTGYRHEAVPASGDWWRSIIHPDDADAVWAAIGKGVDSGAGFVIDYRIRHRDGHYVWLHDHAVIIRGRDGAPDRVIGMVIDISQMKVREEQVFLLMKEVNHRAKNMLGLVQSIARQTAAGDPKEFVARFGRRIQALSANQDLLISNEWTGVEITSLVKAQLSHFADLIGTRINLDGPPLLLQPAAAQALGLALHELATNAGKYGALSDHRGCVSVNWRRDGERFHFH